MKIFMYRCKKHRTTNLLLIVHIDYLQRTFILQKTKPVTSSITKTNTKPIVPGTFNCKFTMVCFLHRNRRVNRRRTATAEFRYSLYGGSTAVSFGDAISPFPRSQIQQHIYIALLHNKPLFVHKKRSP